MTRADTPSARRPDPLNGGMQDRPPASSRPTSKTAAAGPNARAVALDLLHAVLARHQPLADALDSDAALARLSPRDRAFARLLCATTLRRLGEIDGIIGRCLDRPLPRKATAARDILRLGAAQLVFLATPAHAAVDSAVTLAEERRLSPYKGLINAVLRRIAGDPEKARAGLDAARLNTPEWLWESWSGAYGEATCRAIAEAHLEEAPLDLTLHTPAKAGAWAKKLGARLLATGSLRVPRRADKDDQNISAGPRAIPELEGFSEGAWWVQDGAAALPARLLLSALPDGGAGCEIIDLCAAPGGKTAQLAAAGARVQAIDRSAPRLERLSQNLRRLGLAASTIAADAADWRPETPIPALLLDAPCSATGTIRRHPDVARLKTAADVQRLIGVQERLLAAAAEMVAPGGVLVYAVCSLQPEEGPDRIRAFLDGGAPFERWPASAAEVGGLNEFLTPLGELRTLPCHLPGEGGLDGFYAARLRRLG